MQSNIHQQMVSIQKLQDIRYFTPRRVKQYLLITCSAGSVTLQVDDKELMIQENEVLTITSGQYHYFRNVKDAEGYLLDFTLNFVCKNDNDIELIFQARPPRMLFMGWSFRKPNALFNTKIYWWKRSPLNSALKTRFIFTNFLKTTWGYHQKTTKILWNLTYSIKYSGFSIVA